MTDTMDSGEMIARIASAYAGRPDVSRDEILDLVVRLQQQLGDRGAAAPATATGAAGGAAARPGIAERPKPALPLSKAVTQDKVFCLCCGRGFKMLKRHLGAEHGLTEHEYRQMFDLPEDMPLVAPSYSEQKASYAKQAGFGKYQRDGERQKPEKVS